MPCCNLRFETFVITVAGTFLNPRGANRLPEKPLLCLRWRRRDRTPARGMLRREASRSVRLIFRHRALPNHRVGEIVEPVECNGTEKADRQEKTIR